jgi:hypothetical protein
MRIRLPSFGFVYLVFAAAAFAGYFAYIQKSDWWRLPEGRGRDVAESRYLLTLVAGGSKQERINWLSDAMGLASKHAEWELAERILGVAIEHQVKLNPKALIEVVPGQCWVAGSQLASAVVGAAPVAFLAYNKTAPWTLQTEWGASRDGALQTRVTGKGWQSQPIKAGVNASVDWLVPANTISHWEVRADASMFAADGTDQLEDQSGVELKSAKAKQ